jgi:hypothetical protein
MRYADVVSRIKRIQRNGGHPQAKENLIKSLKNQCRLAEGERALKEIERECAPENSVHSFSGVGNKQIGWGEGKKLGSGRWKFDNGKWEKVE